MLGLFGCADFRRGRGVLLRNTNSAYFVENYVNLLARLNWNRTFCMGVVKVFGFNSAGRVTYVET